MQKAIRINQTWAKQQPYKQLSSILNTWIVNKCSPNNIASYIGHFAAKSVCICIYICFLGYFSGVTIIIICILVFLNIWMLWVVRVVMCVSEWEANKYRLIRKSIRWDNVKHQWRQILFSTACHLQCLYIHTSAMNNNALHTS